MSQDDRRVRYTLKISTATGYQSEETGRCTLEQYEQAVASLAGELWHPIELAPKDGTHILVTRCPATTKPPINIAWFSANLLSRHERPWKMTGKKLPYDPTHWQPLPAPPQP